MRAAHALTTDLPVLLFTTALALTLLTAVVSGDEGAPVVAVGAPVTGEIGDDAAEVTSPGLEDPELDLSAPARGVAVRLDLPADGPVTLTLRGWGIDGYLVVRGEDGLVIAENDDGWYWAHPRVVLTAPSVARTVDVVALEGSVGRFELTATAGAPAPPGPDERRRRLEEDAERVLAAVRAGAPVPDYVLRSLAISLMDLEAPRWPPALLEQVVRLRVADLGEQAEDVGVALNDLGLAQADAGDDRAARETLLRALDVLTRAVGPDHRNTLSTVGNLGTVERSLGDLGSAADRFARVVAAKEVSEPEGSAGLAFARLNLAVVQLDNGELDAARPLLLQAVEVFDGEFGPDHALALKARTHLATLHQAMEQNELALPVLEEIVAAYRRLLGEENPQTALALNNLAVCLRSLDRLNEARAQYERATEIFERTVGEDHPMTLLALQNLGQILLHQQDVGRAVRALEEVVVRRRATQGSDHPDTAMAMTTLALASRKLGRHDEERRLLEDAVEVLERRLGPTHPDTLFALGELALTYADQREDTRALALQRRIVRARVERYGADHPDTLHVEVNLAFALCFAGEPDAAIELLERVVPAVERHKGADHADTLGSLDTLVIAYHHAGRHDEARATALRTLGGTSRRLLDQLAARTEEERMRGVQADASRLAWLLSQPVDQAALRAEHEAVLRWKGQVGRSLRRDREVLLGRADATTQADVDRLRTLRRRLVRATEERAVGEEEVLRLRDEVDARESDLLRRLDRDGDVDAVGWDDLHRAIPSDAAFVDLLVFDRFLPPDDEGDGRTERLSYTPSLMAYVFRPSTGRLFRRVVGRLDELEADVARLVGVMDRTRGRPALTAATTRAADPVAEASAALYARLFEPYEELLDGVEHVIVSPDRFLGALPFEVLRDRDGRYLLERFRFSYVSDAARLSEMAATAATRAGPDEVLAVGAVDYGEGAAWAGLPGTARELVEIGARFEGPTVLRGGAATAAAVRQALPKAGLAHLATHGFFVGRERGSVGRGAARGNVEEALLDDSRPGARAGLVLAGANDPTADAILTADDVGWLDLSGLDLVVLSACETGVGQAVGGEGMQSLQRAFHLAGARTVVASLWKVDDAATVTLMRDFYRGLVDEGRAPSEALRAAQLALLARNREVFGDARPWTWGAFVLSGDWR